MLIYNNYILNSASKYNYKILKTLHLLIFLIFVIFNNY